MKRRKCGDFDLSDISSDTDSSSVFSDDLNSSSVGESEYSSDDTIECPTASQPGPGPSTNSGNVPFVWTRQKLPFPIFPFTGNAGIQVNINDKEDPLEYFELFVTDELVDLIVKQTNLYAKQYLDSVGTLKPRSRFRKWKETDANEIRILFAFLMYQGVVWKPDTQLYYTRNKLFETPGIKNIISLSRLVLLKKFMHFVDNTTLDPSVPAKLTKIKPVLDYVVDRFSKVYRPARDICVDESLMLWKGRLSWKQYIPNKRARFGIKSYILTESESAYIWNMIVYTGKGTCLDPALKEYAHGTQVVLSLTEELLDKGYRLYVDNFYTSPELLAALYERTTDAVGTVRKNRKNLPQELNTKIQKGDAIFFYEISRTNKMMAVKWHDKREVSFMSTIHDDSKVTVRRRGKQTEVLKVVQDYNCNMGGVDRMDQMLGSYPMERKRCKVAYKKQFNHILNMCVLNSYILYSKQGGKKTHLAFRMALIEAIIAKYKDVDSNNGGNNGSGSSGRPSNGTNPIRMIMRHFPSYVPCPGNKKNCQKRCVVCSKNGKRKDSRFWCKDCDVGLCAAPCFGTYHTVYNY